VRIDYVVDPFPSDAELAALWRSAWGMDGPAAWSTVLPRSLAHVGAYSAHTPIGFVNVAWDGRAHAFLLDTCVDKAWQRRGIGTRLVGEAAAAARRRGAEWLHVDFEERYTAFYRAAGFQKTEAGLLRLGQEAVSDGEQRAQA
jgi:GNAT superfamily N-acetyltransferase